MENGPSHRRRPKKELSELDQTLALTDTFSTYIRYAGDTILLSVICVKAERKNHTARRKYTRNGT